jgi:hypothetical protein
MLTVVDDAIKLVASHAVSITREKANSDDMITVDEEVSSSDDIQGSKENCSHVQQSPTTATTNNSVF